MSSNSLKNLAISSVYFGTTFLVWSGATRTVHELLDLVLDRVQQRTSGFGSRRRRRQEVDDDVETARALLDEALAAFLLVAWNLEAYNQVVALGHTAYGVALLLTGVLHYASNTEANPCNHFAE